MCESQAILEYIEETFPPPDSPSLWPARTRERAHARWLSAAMHSGFPKLRESMSFHLCFLPERPAASAEALAEAAEILALWESALRSKTSPGPFLFGAFGAVDAMYAPVVVRLTAFGVPTQSTPLAAEYMKAMLVYPAVNRWLEPARKLTPVAHE